MEGSDRASSYPLVSQKESSSILYLTLWTGAGALLSFTVEDPSCGLGLNL